MRAFLVGIALTFVSVNCIILKTPNGRLEGAYNGRYFSFLNVPYAEPPTGRNRFEPPVRYTQNWSGVRNATGPAVTCVAFSKAFPASNGIEDCLVLHIFTPNITQKRLYPVHVHLHGGAFMIGSGGAIDESYSASKDMVLVLPNYRLGPLGFLSSGDDTVSGNFGLKDQQLALEWVYRNIDVFGGDKKKILLSGFSAGGTSVHLHMLNRKSARFFNAAWSRSGVALSPWAFQPNPQPRFQQFGALLGCDGEIKELVKTCLQSRSKEELFEATNAMKVFTNNPVNVFGVVIEWDVKDPFLPVSPRLLMARGQIPNIPWIVSYCERDGIFTAAEFLSYDEDGTELIGILNSRWREIAPISLCYNDSCIGCPEVIAADVRDTYSDYLRLKYMGAEAFSVETYRQLENMFTDVMFVDGVREVIDLHRRYGRGQVFAYDYRNPVNFGIGNLVANRMDIHFGADHGSDLAYVLPLRILNQSGAETPNSRFVSENLIQMGMDLTLIGVATYGGIALPTNNATQTGKLIIYESYFEIETLTADGVYTKSTFNNPI